MAVIKASIAFAPVRLILERVVGPNEWRGKLVCPMHWVLVNSGSTICISFNRMSLTLSSFSSELVEGTAVFRPGPAFSGLGSRLSALGVYTLPLSEPAMALEALLFRSVRGFFFWGP